MTSFSPRILISAAILAAAAACSDGRGSAPDPAEIEEARTAAARDAAAAAAQPDGSMEREKTILSMRARESALRAEGFDLAADAYADAAGEELRRLHVIP